VLAATNITSPVCHSSPLGATSFLNASLTMRRGRASLICCIWRVKPTATTDSLALRLASALGALIALSGCVPALRTLQPATRVHVTDADGIPLQGASVQLGSYKYRGGRFSTQNYVTNAAGDAKTKRDTQWELMVFLPDGINYYSWHLCVEKPGYQPTTVAMPKAETRLEVVLLKTSATLQCKWLEGVEGRLSAPEIVARGGHE